jgi:hypothetical protein
VVEAVGANHKVVLESEEGKVLVKKTLYGNDQPAAGTSLKLNPYEVEVGEEKGEGDGGE